MPAPDQPELVRQLLEPAAYPHPTGTIRLVETHISWVFLTGPFVYKVKKPVNLGFLDFTDLDERRRLCTEEVRVSGRFAPAIYLGAVPITGSAGAPRIDGPGTPIEWAVKLVQFDEANRLDALFEAGRLTAADCETLGAEIARVEESLAVAGPASGWGTPESVRAATATICHRLREARPDAAARVDRVEAWIGGRLEAAHDVIHARITAGRVRECHGDLHLANIVLHDGRMTAFDAIEFSPNLRWIDVANDVAFLVMDLHARGRPDLAAHVASAWMEAADDHAAAAVLPIYEVYRAVVRAGVAAIRGGQHAADAADRADADRYLDLAERLMMRGPPTLYATCGISGSGKTTLAAAVVAARGAVRLRSDVERKRLLDMRPTDRAADAVAERNLYDEATTRRVYHRLAVLAATVLRAGTSVVVDAACLRRWQRDEIAAAAAEARVPLVWLECEVPEAEAIARVHVRRDAGADASDASADVVRSQVQARDPIAAEELGGDRRAVRITATDRAGTDLATLLAAVSGPAEVPAVERTA
jgi:aminoglycoside phosphotransferase family enzyme/predicted kinase